ncbi:hypothetical protein DFJ74DRAFT_775688 [Hyaloraphidium curvatum]|nr:hypothetical protein DFJ74DRAFT_775688 [Hyaloraphidium curvatum]
MPPRPPLRNLSDALCATCGRNLPLKPAPAATPMKYCSAKCRSRKPGELDALIEGAMLHMAREREAAYRTGRAGRKGAGVTCEEVEEAVRGLVGPVAADGTDEGLDADGRLVGALDPSSPPPRTLSLPVDLRERTRQAARRLAGRNLVALYGNGRELPSSGAAGVMEVRIREGREAEG